MNLVVDVPLNTILADLDESLRELLKRELGRHGFDGVDIVFDAPTTDWSSQVAKPTVNLFLYDLRESLDRRRMEWETLKTNGRPRDVRPPLLMECSYTVTAWTQAVEDEHRLLSQVLAILHAYSQLPQDVLTGLAANAPLPIEGVVGLPRAEGKADFWTAVQGIYKASIDYVAMVPIKPSGYYERGPEVRARTIRTRVKDGSRSTIEELQAIAGIVRDADGEPLENAWVVLPELGKWTASNLDGSFEFQNVPPGTIQYHLRGPDGSESKGELQVPGTTSDLIIGTKVAVSRKRK